MFYFFLLLPFFLGGEGEAGSAEHGINIGFSVNPESQILFMLISCDTLRGCIFEKWQSKYCSLLSDVYDRIVM